MCQTKIKHRMFKPTTILLLLAIHATGTLSAQEKFEKESRIRLEEVPAEALLFVDSLKVERRVKWYREESLVGTSFEAKFKHDRSCYSVEFDTLGRVEDIEVEIAWADVPSEIRDPIALRLAMDCTRHKVVKVQEQYTGTTSSLLHILRADGGEQPLRTNYELIVRCRQERSVDLYEYLFSGEGGLLSRAKIVFRNSSHLEY